MPMTSYTINFDQMQNRRQNKFKALFACQNHVVKPPPLKKVPIWRVHTLLMRMEFMFPLILTLGVAVPIDETTMCLKGHHAYKKYDVTKKGYGLQTYPICQKG